MTLVKPVHNGDPDSVRSSECEDLLLLISWQLTDALLMPCRCYSAYILVQFMCSCNTCTGGAMSRAFSTGCALICRCSEQLLTSCLNHSFLECLPPTVETRDMSVLGPLVSGHNTISGQICCYTSLIREDVGGKIGKGSEYKWPARHSAYKEARA